MSRLRILVKKYLLICVMLSLLLPTTALAASRLPCTPTEGAQGSNDLFTCINNVYKYALVISSIAAVMMIIFAGYAYIFSGGNEKQAASAKSWISTSLVGLAVLLTGFLLLRQINPNLLTIKSISPESIDQQNWTQYQSDDKPWSGGASNAGYTQRAATNLGQWKDLIDKYAKQNQIDPCIISAVMRQEDPTGDPNAIGHDGGKRGDDTFTNTPPKFGLNWDHSHGLGLMQLTVFPYTHRYGRWPDPNVPARQWFGKWYTVAEQLNPETSVSVGSRYLKELLKRANGDVQTAFGNYNGSGRNGAYALKVIGFYNLCTSSGG